MGNVGRILERSLSNEIVNARPEHFVVFVSSQMRDGVLAAERQAAIEGVRADGAVVIPVIVGPCRFGSVPELSSLQAANDPARPLTTLPVAERERVWVRVADAIEAAFANREPTDGWRVANEQLVLEALQQVVREKVGSFLIVESGDYYVQFLTSAETLYLEVVGNTFLPERLRLDRDKEARLVALGFRRPRSDHPNFDREYASSEATSQLRSLATLAVKVMADVFEVSQNARLQIQVNRES